MIKNCGQENTSASKIVEKIMADAEPEQMCSGIRELQVLFACSFCENCEI